MTLEAWWSAARSLPSTGKRATGMWTYEEQVECFMLERTQLTKLLSDICRYEKEHGLPFQYLNVAITAQGHGGAFQVRPPIRIQQRHDRIADSSAYLLLTMAEI